jgi:hypothetical protein
MVRSGWIPEALMSASTANSTHSTGPAYRAGFLPPRHGDRRDGSRAQEGGNHGRGPPRGIRDAIARKTKHASGCEELRGLSAVSRRAAGRFTCEDVDIR